MFNTKLILLIQMLQIESTISMPFYINLNLQHCESVILQKCGYSQCEDDGGTYLLGAFKNIVFKTLRA